MVAPALPIGVALDGTLDRRSAPVGDLDTGDERRIEVSPGRDLGDDVLLPAVTGALLHEKRQIDRVGAVRLGRDVVSVQVTQLGEDLDEFGVEIAVRERGRRSAGSL